jgi:four helix bundle protein
MSYRKFEDIIGWQKAQDLAVEIYACLEACRDWHFKEQICRASISISNNIAEGSDRSSHADYKRYLYFALGSSSEVKSMLYLANRLKYIDDETTATLVNKCSEICRIINGLIKSLRVDVHKKLTPDP